LQTWPKIQAYLQQDAESCMGMNDSENLLLEIAPVSVPQ